MSLSSTTTTRSTSVIRLASPYNTHEQVSYTDTTSDVVKQYFSRPRQSSRLPWGRG